MNSHFLHMLLYAAIVATFFAILVRRERREQIRLLATLWLVRKDRRIATPVAGD